MIWMQRKFQKYNSLLLALLVLLINGCQGMSKNLPWRSKFNARQIVVIINRQDPLSLQIGEYYQTARNIPKNNLIYLEFDPAQTIIRPAEFKRLKALIDAKVDNRVQAFALTWASPYRVGCMSITTAFALGFDPKYCAKGCKPTPQNPYFNSDSNQPYSDLGLRPTMAIAATNFANAKTLIDRGIISDNTHPKGTAYLLATSDKARNVRAKFYPALSQYFASKFAIKILQQNALRNQSDVMFYFTGTAKVNHLPSNQFRPGAVGDHLTSFGGKLTNPPEKQMSSLRWLEAGATGSYGTVVEPCNFPQKFPHPGILMSHYLEGATLIEAYWKSVAWLGQGIFIGEPLARPFQR